MIRVNFTQYDTKPLSIPFLTDMKKQLRVSTTKEQENSASSKQPNIATLNTNKKEAARPIFKRPLTLVAYKKPDLAVSDNSSKKRSLGGPSAKISSGTDAASKHGLISSKSVQKPKRGPISKKLTTDVGNIPEIVAPNFEKRILKLKEEMATLEIQGSKESKKKTAVFDNDNGSSSTHLDHHQDEFEYDHFDYSDSESDCEYESDSGDDYEEHGSYGHYDYYYSTDSDSEYESESDDDSNYQSSDSDEYEDNSVWVGNIPKTAGADDLNSVFGKFGKIIHVTIRSTNHPTFNYAFIDFKTSGSAQALLRSKCEESFFLDGIELVVAKRH